MSEPDAPYDPPRRWRVRTERVRGRVVPFAARLGFELLVVFLGVYGASAFADYQQGRRVARERREIERALAAEIRDITANTRNAERQTGRLLAVYDSLWTAGQQPPLQPLIEPVRFQTHLWETTLQSGRLGLLGVETAYALSAFYNELNAGFGQLGQLRGLSETMILPNLDTPAAFYDPATGRLKQGYGWYVQGVQALHDEAGRITVLGDSLVRTLERP